MKIYFDTNFFDYLFENQVQLEEYFPASHFELFVTKHCKFEFDQLPESEPLKLYFKQLIGSVIEIYSHFGYRDPSLPENEQRLDGFGAGRFASSAQQKFTQKLKGKYGSGEKRKRSLILYKQEADIELASRSLDAVVVTFDAKDGPLVEAKRLGGKIVILNRTVANQMPVDEFMSKLLHKINSADK